MKQLKAEKTRLKKLVAERDIEIEVMKEINEKTGERAGSPIPDSVRAGSRAVGAAGLDAGQVGDRRRAMIR